MKAHLFKSDYDGASNGGSGSDEVCVDRKVHLTLLDSWYDQSGDPGSACDSVRYQVLGPCDGSCLPTRELPPEAEELVLKFLASDGQELGTYERSTARYPDAVDRGRWPDDEDHGRDWYDDPPDAD